MPKEMVIIADYSKETSFSLEELCEICHISSDTIHAYIEFEIIHPAGKTPTDWKFDINHLSRVKTGLRLQHDLEVNLAGVAVVLDLLDEVDELRARLEVFEKHFANL